MKWLPLLQTLPVIALGLREPTDAECIDKEVGDVKIIVTHQYLPHHQTCYVGSLSGPTISRDQLIKMISAEIGQPIVLDKINPNIWMSVWQSGSLDRPMTDLRRVLTDFGIEAIITNAGVADNLRWVVVDLVALSEYFRFDLELETAYINFHLQSAAEMETNKVMAALVEINRRYAELTKNT